MPLNAKISLVLPAHVKKLLEAKAAEGGSSISKELRSIIDKHLNEFAQIDHRPAKDDPDADAS
jgi:hypothetical protein